jgi:hypothetical protein
MKEIIDIVKNWKINWNLNPEINEIIQMKENIWLISNDWITIKILKLFYFSRDLNF